MTDRYLRAERLLIDTAEFLLEYYNMTFDELVAVLKDGLEGYT